MCHKKIALFDSSEFNLARTRTTRNARNSRNGFALMCTLSHEKRKIEYREYKKLLIHIRMTKSTKYVRIDANKGSKINEYYQKIIHN